MKKYKLIKSFNKHRAGKLKENKYQKIEKKMIRKVLGKIFIQTFKISK